MPYTSYDHDKLEAAETMRIERRIYFEAKDGDIAPYASLPIAQLLSMRSESAAAEQAIFDSLKEQAAAWEEQAGKTLLLDKALEYVRTPHVQHTANEWRGKEHKPPTPPQ
ncbi:antirestriction protein, partial [Clostridioides difficile]|nr:antirestriction protein [Clostridioides difficile]